MKGFWRFFGGLFGRKVEKLFSFVVFFWGMVFLGCLLEGFCGLLEGLYPLEDVLFVVFCLFLWGLKGCGWLCFFGGASGFFLDKPLVGWKSWLRCFGGCSVYKTETIALGRLFDLGLLDSNGRMGFGFLASRGEDSEISEESSPSKLLSIRAYGA